MVSMLDISGDIDGFTPQIVIDHILTSHGAKNFKNISPILLTNGPKLSTLAKFVNGNVSWKWKTLKVALNFIIGFNSSMPEILDTISSRTAGLPSPEEPEKLSPTLLYALCKQLDIRCNIDTGLDDMYFALKNYDNKDVLLTEAIRRLNETNGCEIASIICQLPSINIPAHSTYDLDFLSRVSRSEYSKIRPRNSSEAIVLSALTKRIDLSQAIAPMIEYSRLRTQRVYHPVDVGIVSYISNGGTIHMDEKFNVNLPQILYSEEVIVNLAENEGYVASDISPYNYLVTCTKTNTFYHGISKSSNIGNDSLVLGDLVADANMESLVSYGIIANENNHPATCVAYSYKDLLQTFNSLGDFIDPMSVDRNPFPPGSIRKLQKLCEISRRYSETNIEHKIRMDLSESISRICSDIASIFRVYEAYIASPFASRFAWCMFKLAMYMRGWDGVGEYPIERAPVDDQIQVDIQVSGALVEIHKVIEDEMNSKTSITAGNITVDTGCDLPSIVYEKHRYRTGTTLGSKIGLVMDGESTEDINSCIRLNSNYFLTSSVYLLKLMGEDCSVDLTNMNIIS